LVSLDFIKRLHGGVKMDFRWEVCKGGRWLELAQESVPWWALMQAVQAVPFNIASKTLFRFSFKKV